MPRSNARDRADGVLRTIADGSVVADDIAAGAITDAKIASGAITNTKLAPSSRVQGTSLVNLTFDSAQTLDLSQGNFFDADSTSGTNTTLSFANVPTAARWNYKVKHGSITTAIPGTLPTTSWTNNATGKDLTTLQAGSYIGVTVSPDGHKLYALDQDSLLYVTQFDMSTAHDLSTLTYVNRKQLSSGAPQLSRGLNFKPDGTRFFIGDYYGGVYQYDLSTPWDISTATYNSVSLDTSGLTITQQGCNTSADGTRIYVNNYNTDVLYQYNLSTAWDLSTASYASKSFNYLSVISPSAASLFTVINPEKDKMWFFAGGNLEQANFGTAGDLDTLSDASITYDYTTGNAVGNSYDGTFIVDSNNIGRIYFIEFSTTVGVTENVYNDSGGGTTTTQSTVTLPASVKNTLSSTPDSDNPQQIIEFLTVDSGANIYITNDFVTTT